MTWLLCGRRRRRFAIAVLGPLVAIAGAAAPAHATSVTVGPGQTYALSADLALDSGDTLDAEGTADSPCVIQGNQFQITAAAFEGSIKIVNCQVVGLGAMGTPAAIFTLNQTGTIQIQSTTFSQCGQLQITANDAADVTIVGNDFGDDAVVNPDLTSFTTAEPAMYLIGNSSATKHFQGNRVLRSFVELLQTSHWQIGGLNEGDGNILYGLRGGLYASNVDDVAIQGNYMRTPAPWDGLNQLTSLRFDGLTTHILVEHNVLRGSNAIIAGDPQGEIRYNVIADPHAAFWVYGMHGKSAVKIHHNLLLRSEAVEPTANYWQMVGLAVAHDSSDTGPTAVPMLEFYNNTMDTADCYNPPGAGVAVEPDEIVASIRSNVFTRMEYVQAAVASYAGTASLEMAADPGPVKMAYADYNDFYNVNAVRVDNYAISAANETERIDPGFGLHDLGTPGLKNQQVDPKLTGPQPRVFPFQDTDIVARSVTVCQMLAFYRNAYAPAAGSPLIDAGDPQDGPGVDIGAIGAATGTPDPSDIFGLVCAADLSSLPAIPSSSYVCPQTTTSTTGGGTGTGGASPTTPPGFLCVCSVARAPSAGEGIALVVLLGVALVGRARRRAS